MTLFPSKQIAWSDPRMTEELRLAGTSGDELVQAPVHAGSPRAGCPGPCLVPVVQPVFNTWN